MTHRAAVICVILLAVTADIAASFGGPTLVRWNTAPILTFPKLLLWNASASVPRGLYWVRPAEPLRIGELVSALPPAPLRQFLAARGYLSVGVPLLKHIAALPGQTVCRTAHVISIGGNVLAFALDHDSDGRPLPVWQGCRTLRAGQVFLLNRTVSNSFDGRYFGPLPRSSIVGRAVPLWTEPAP